MLPGNDDTTRKLCYQCEGKWHKKSIHPSIQFLPLIWVQVVGAAVFEDMPRPPSPQTHSSAPPEGSQGDPKPDQRGNLSTVSWLCPEVSSWLDLLKHLL